MEACDATDVAVITLPGCPTWKKNFVSPLHLLYECIRNLNYVYIIFQEAENIITPFLQSGKYKEALFKVKMSQQRAQDETKLVSCFNNEDNAFLFFSSFLIVFTCVILSLTQKSSSEVYS